MNQFSFYDEIVPRRVELDNSRGQRILGLECVMPGRKPQGCVVITPGYGKHARHFGFLSRYLTRHGFRTVRFDFTNHVGNSDGDILDLTLSSMADDIESVLKDVRGRHPGENLYLLSPSLSARAATRALARVPAPEGVVLVLPVVDVEATLTRVIGVNVVERWRQGIAKPGEPIKVIDHTVYLDFVGDALDRGFVGVDRAAADLAAVASPVTVIAGQDDEWVHTAELRRALDATAQQAKGARSLVVLDALTHDPLHNPPLMRLIMEQILQALQPAAPIIHLEFEEVVETVKAERKWARDAQTLAAAL